MGYKCAVFGCDTGYEGGGKHPTFFFPKDTHLKEKWEKLVNRRNCKCTSYSVICAKHFEAKNIKEGEKRDKLRCELQPIPTIHDNLTTCVVHLLHVKLLKNVMLVLMMNGKTLKPTMSSVTLITFRPMYVQNISLT